MIDTVLATKLIYDATLVGCCGYAICFGGMVERIGAAIAIAATGATALVLPVSGWLDLDGRYGFALLNLATLLAFDALMVRSRAFWPIWATGIQLASVALDLAMVIKPVDANSYLLVQGKFAYPILFSLVLGSERARRMRRAL
jgi:hypothetical protein